MAIPTTEERVPTHTAETVNERILDEARNRIRYYAAHKDLIGQRLEQLNAEWDIERAIEANASSLAFIGVCLGYLASPAWLILPALITAFLFQHAIQGWCPPVPVLRRMGFRTVYEIERERYALKALRGDFVGAEQSADAAMRAAGLQSTL